MAYLGRPRAVTSASPWTPGGPGPHCHPLSVQSQRPGHSHLPEPPSSGRLCLFCAVTYYHRWSLAVLKTGSCLWSGFREHQSQLIAPLQEGTVLSLPPAQRPLHPPLQSLLCPPLLHGGTVTCLPQDCCATTERPGMPEAALALPASQARTVPAVTSGTREGGGQTG